MQSDSEALIDATPSGAFSPSFSVAGGCFWSGPMIWLTSW
jgi:hypothetical protein